jgi:hypothetical protein
MKITEDEKQTVIAALQSNPRFTTEPTTYADLLIKTGFRSGKLNCVKAALIAEGKIWEDKDDETRRKVIYLVIADKRQQILDLLKRRALGPLSEYPMRTSDFTTFCKISSAHAHDILLRLANESILSIASIQVRPSPQWAEAVESAAAEK